MSKILIVIPHDRFHDEEFKTLYDFFVKENEVEIGSSHHTEVQGHNGLLVKPDINVSFVERGDYEALIFIGGRGVDEYQHNPQVISLVRRFKEERKCIGAIGRSVEILAYAGILTSLKVTADIGTLSILKAAGAFYTGTAVEKDGNIVTGIGSEASLKFAETVNDVLKWGSSKGEIYARTARS